MHAMNWTRMGTLLLCASLAGCGKSTGGASAPTGAATSAHVHTHGAWWCDEHGVPEEVCALCDRTLVAEFKARGDWCKEHERPDSQCFICHPEREAEFAAEYEARYGKQPPKPHDHEGHDHEGHDHDGHDHEGHDHEGHDHDGHDHDGEDHEGHDHDDEDHGHDHDGHDHDDEDHDHDEGEDA